MTDALDRLKNKQRPSVPARDTSIAAMPVSGSVDTSTSRIQDIKVSRTQYAKKSKVQDIQGADVGELKTKQTTMRLEEGISDRLQEMCRRQGLSREVLIEAMFLQCEADPKLLDEVLAAALVRNQERLEVANRKRAQTMMEKFGQS